MKILANSDPWKKNTRQLKVALAAVFITTVAIRLIVPGDSETVTESPSEAPSTAGSTISPVFVQISCTENGYPKNTEDQTYDPATASGFVIFACMESERPVDAENAIVVDQPAPADWPEPNTSTMQVDVTHQPGITPIASTAARPLWDTRDGSEVVGVELSLGYITGIQKVG